MIDETHRFKIESKFSPTGDQPQAISSLVDGIREGKRWQVLKGATGTGKTFTMANIIERVQRTTMVLVHNKTLAAQLFGELKELFPNNRVEYFISNFDFYQPEAYIPKTDTYIDKQVVMNDEIEMMRSSAVNSLLERKDTIVVCSVASIYGLSDPDEYRNLSFTLHVGEPFNSFEIAKKLVISQYKRNDVSLEKGTFRIKGECMDICPPSNDDYYIRVYSDFDTISEIYKMKMTTDEVIYSMEYYPIFPAHEHASGLERLSRALGTIKEELTERLAFFEKEGKLLECERLKMRTEHDLDSLREFGMCAGVENYSRHFDGRKEGETPYTLLDYFPKDFLLFIDESHVSIPQISGMYNGDRARKKTLVDYGFRLPSALDNRPLRYDEFEKKINNVICLSATPGDYELEKCDNRPVEQLIRPTGLLDPIIEVRYNSNNPIYDLLEEIKKRIEKNERVLVISLTIKDAENLTQFLKERKIKVTYIQHEILTLERTEIIYKLRKGIYDVVVGINLLREGLDIPEVSLIAILDSDRQGFLRSERSLTQIVGRAARNENGRVIMYCDNISEAMRRTIDETKRRRMIQNRYNEEHNITPKTIKKAIIEPVRMIESKIKVENEAKLSKKELDNIIKKLTAEMMKASKELDFEKAALLRDKIFELKSR
ncbi:MAG: excinuclease ABC subunit UvrB [Candidatus Enterosoma sp.]|nr:excinuclease ABC subunit UvrB [Bacilli bacterium]MDD7607906.1 excinuclease ABC subunit UvrB [bacterium]MDY5650073.1 excinuclease ABC subunit UvrB [Candidatus Enterosoma sp.]MDY5865739.1 excinuclease ABC subunit UvrB [Candidatus Enterosoma sp.]